MSDSDKNFVMVLLLILCVILFIAFAVTGASRDEHRTFAIDNGCAYYHSKTGELTWGDSNGKEKDHTD